MTKIEIIEETVKYYSEDTSRRAVGDDENCKYLTRDGKTCAYGRCMTIDALDISKDFQGGVLRLLTQKFQAIEEMNEMKKYIHDEPLQHKYHGHNVAFWMEIQQLHDYPEYWDDNGLTHIGERFVGDLKAKYANQ